MRSCEIFRMGLDVRSVSTIDGSYICTWLWQKGRLWSGQLGEQRIDRRILEGSPGAYTLCDAKAQRCVEMSTRKS